jgi:hypothetical protein
MLPPDPISPSARQAITIKPSRPLTPETRRSEERVRDLRRTCEAHFQPMADALAHAAIRSGLRPVHATYLCCALKLAADRHIDPPARLAKRKKPALICWFCQNCLDILDNPYVLKSALSTVGAFAVPADDHNGSDCSFGSDGQWEERAWMKGPFKPKTPLN